MLNYNVVSKGMGYGKVYKLSPLNLNIFKKRINSADKEVVKYNDSIVKAKNDILNIINILKNKLANEQVDIFESHLLLIEDVELKEKVINTILEENTTAEYALLKVRNEYVSLFESMDDVYMKERSIDVKDVTNRMIAHLTNQTFSDLLSINEPVILVCEDLSPSETAQLDKKNIKGIVSLTGGHTSHSAILARSLGIPCLIGEIKQLKSNSNIVIDAINGIIDINPTKDDIEKVDIYNLEIELLNKKLYEFINKKTVSLDNKEFKLYSNISSINDLEEVKNNGAEGIGLFRTEFIYMNQKYLPTLDEQYEIYKTVLETQNGKDVTIRTLDIGGDKELNYLSLPKEENPFLGSRAIRLCLERKDIFKTQLKALLKASVFGNLKILIPMISVIEELIEVKDIIKSIEEELSVEKIYPKYKLGMMIEVPGVVYMLDHFLPLVDFVSIGTNDLIQYSFAADRLNNKVSYLYQPLNPAILNMINIICSKCKNHSVDVCVCGESASDEDVVLLLLSMGVSSLSMTSSYIPKIRYFISNVDISEFIKKGLTKALNSRTQNEVIKIIKER